MVIVDENKYIDKQFLYTDITDKSSFGSNVNF